MKILVLNQREVRELLPMAECMIVMTRALKILAQGLAVQPLRTAMRLPDGKGLLGLMPAYLGGFDVHGLKVVNVFPDNHGTEYDSHQGAVLLFEGEHGCPVVIMDGTEITAIRTAAVSGVATMMLARQEAQSLGILGAGTQARTHLAAMVEVREIRSVRVWSRNPASAQRFAETESRRHGLAVEAVTSARDAVDGADIVCTTTAATAPVLAGEWLTPGAHINAVGACVPASRELDTAAVRRASLFVDCRESLLNEAGDFLIPVQEGAIGDDHIRGEIGELLIGRIEGRRSADEITLFKSLGIGVEDLAAGQHVYIQAKKRGIGTSIEFSDAPDAAD